MNVKRLVALCFFGTFTSCVCGLAAPELSLRWVMFTLWFLPVFLSLAYSILPRDGECGRHSSVSSQSEVRGVRDSRWYYAATLGIIITLHWIYLWSYPYPAFHDEIRDGALRGLEIANGTLRNFFSTDWSQGLLFATMTGILYQALGSDVLIYRILGALITTAHILLIYRGFGRVVGYRTSFWMAVFLGTSGVHLFFSRTETLIAFSTFLTTAGLLTAYRLWTVRAEKLNQVVLPAGLLLGLGLNFHASARVPLFALVGAGLASLLFTGRTRGITFRQVVISALLLIFVTLCATGPQLLYVSTESWVGSSRIVKDISFEAMFTQYVDSLRIYSGALLQSKMGGEVFLWRDFQILLPIAALYCLRWGSIASYMALGLLFIIPFTNSAFTDGINQPQRILPLIPLCALLLAELVSRVVRIRTLYIGIVCVLVLVSVRISEIKDFFLGQRATRFLQQETVLPLFVTLRHIAEFVKAEPEWQASSELWIFVRASTPLHSDLLPPHVVEFFMFFMPNKKVKIVGVPHIAEKTLYLSTTNAEFDGAKLWKEVPFCPSTEYFACVNPSFPVYIPN